MQSTEALMMWTMSPQMANMAFDTERHRDVNAEVSPCLQHSTFYYATSAEASAEVESVEDMATNSR